MGFLLGLAILFLIGILRISRILQLEVAGPSESSDKKLSPETQMQFGGSTQSLLGGLESVIQTINLYKIAGRLHSVKRGGYATILWGIFVSTITSLCYPLST